MGKEGEGKGKGELSSAAAFVLLLGFFFVLCEERKDWKREKKKVQMMKHFVIFAMRIDGGRGGIGGEGVEIFGGGFMEE